MRVYEAIRIEGISAELYDSGLLTQPLADAGCEAFEYDDTNHRLTAYALKEQLPQEVLVNLLGSFAIVGSVLREEMPACNWNAEAEQRVGVLSLAAGGRTLAIVPPNHNAPEAQYTLHVASSMAFGDGHHPSTRMLLEGLLEKPPQGSVLDMGCGTGILALVAARMGASPVEAIDIDSDAIQCARENLARNQGLEVTLRKGDFDSIQPQLGGYSRILANLNTNLLLAHLPLLARILAPEGALWMSGFLSADTATLAKAASPHGLAIEWQREHEGWGALALTRKQSPHHA